MTRFDIVLSFTLIGLGLGAFLGAITGGIIFTIVVIAEAEFGIFAFIILALGFGMFIGLAMGSFEGVVLGLITALCFPKTIPRLYLPILMLTAVTLTFLVLWKWNLTLYGILHITMLASFPIAMFGAWCLGKLHIDHLKRHQHKADESAPTPI